MAESDVVPEWRCVKPEDSALRSRGDPVNEFRMTVEGWLAVWAGWTMVTWLPSFDGLRMAFDVLKFGECFLS